MINLNHTMRNYCKHFECLISTPPPRSPWTHEKFPFYCSPHDKALQGLKTNFLVVSSYQFHCLMKIITITKIDVHSGSFFAFMF